MHQLKILILAIFIVCACTQPDKPRQGAVINHTAIYVTDLTVSRSFYNTVIGLDTIPEPFNDGKHAWFSLGNGVALHIIEGADQRREYFKNQHTCLSVGSVDAFVSQLKTEGIEWEDRDGARQAVTTRVDGVKQIWLRDPDGYWIEINDAKE